MIDETYDLERVSLTDTWDFAIQHMVLWIPRSCLL